MMLHAAQAPIDGLERTGDSYVGTLLRTLCSLILFFGLSHLYIEYISTYFAYYGFSYQSIPRRLPVALLVVVTLSVFLRPHIGNISALTSALCHFFFLTPTAVMFVYGGLFTSIFAWTIAIQMALIIASMLNLRLGSRIGIPLNGIIRGLLVIALIGLALIIYQNGILSLSFNIFEVYDRRVEANLTDAGALGYLTQMGAQAALLLTAVAFHNRKWFMTVVGFGVAVLFFAYSGHKSTVFWALFLIGCIYIAQFRNKFLYLLLGATAFVWLVVALIETTIGLDLLSFLIRRTLFTPVLLNQYYMMFAQQFGFLEWSYSKVGLGLFEYGDTISPTQAVGYYLTGSDENSANTGMIGFGYINAGHAGVTVYLVVFLSILVAATGLAKEKQIEVLGAAVMIRSTYFAVTTTDLPSTILSGGLGYSILVLLLYPAARAVRDQLSGPAGPSIAPELASASLLPVVRD